MAKASKPVNAPSTTGKPSGSNRGNNAPKPPAPSKGGKK